MLNSRQRFEYALPALIVYFMMGPLTVLQGVYAQYFGLSLSTIASVILISRLFDAVTDPIIGAISDLHVMRGGSRKGFVAIGGVLFVISCYFLFVPPVDVTASYFLVWFLAFYVSYTLFEIPHLAWGASLGSSSSEKTKIYTARAFAISVGIFLFFIVPLLPMFDSSHITPKTLKWSASIAALLMIPMLYLCITNVPSRSEYLNLYKKYNARNRRGVYFFLNVIYNNIPFLWFMAAFGCYGVGVGMWFSMLFIFSENYLHYGEFFAIAYAMSFAISIATISIWPLVARILGKKVVWVIAVLMIAAGVHLTGILEPGLHSKYYLLVVLILVNVGTTALNVVVPSVLAEIIDYGAWKFGSDSAGFYFSLYTLATKGNLAIGSALGLGIASGYGFQAASDSQSIDAIFGARLAISWIPTPLLILSTIFILLIRIDSRRHAVLQARIDS